MGKAKLSWKQKVEIAHKAYRPYNGKFAIDVKRLRMDLFGEDRIPKEKWGSYRIEVFNTRKESLGLQTIFLNASKSVGDMQTRGGRGHRMLILCPACGLDAENQIPVGRLHQHYGYKHPMTIDLTIPRTQWEDRA